MKMAKQFLHIMEILKNKLNKTVYIHILYFLVLCDRQIGSRVNSK